MAMNESIHTRPDLHIPDMTKHQLVKHLQYHHRNTAELVDGINSFLGTERNKQQLTNFHERIHNG